MKRKIKGISAELLDVHFVGEKTIMFSINLDEEVYPDLDFEVSQIIVMPSLTAEDKEYINLDTLFEFMEDKKEIEKFDNYVFSQFIEYFNNNNIKPLELC